MLLPLRRAILCDFSTRLPPCRRFFRTRSSGLVDRVLSPRVGKRQAKHLLVNGLDAHRTPRDVLKELRRNVRRHGGVAVNAAALVLSIAEDRGEADASHYAAFIRVCGENKQWERALRAHDSMVENGIAATDQSWGALVVAYSKARQFKRALQLRERIGAEPGDFTLQSMLRAGVNGRSWRDAALCVEECDRRSIPVHPTLRMAVDEAALSACDDLEAE